MEIVKFCFPSAKSPRAHGRTEKFPPIVLARFVASAIIYQSRRRPRLQEAVFRFRKTLLVFGRFLRSWCWSWRLRHSLYKRCKALRRTDASLRVARQPRKRLFSRLTFFHNSYLRSRTTPRRGFFLILEGHAVRTMCKIALHVRGIYTATIKRVRSPGVLIRSSVFTFSNEKEFRAPPVQILDHGSAQVDGHINLSADGPSRCESGRCSAFRVHFVETVYPWVFHSAVRPLRILFCHVPIISEPKDTAPNGDDRFHVANILDLCLNDDLLTSLNWFSEPNVLVINPRPVGGL
jgi:hypothetical protein